MIVNNSPAVTQIPVVDFERAVHFYQNVLGLKPKRMYAEIGIAVFEAGQGTSLSLYKRGPTTADHTIMEFEVEDIETAMNELSERGVVFEQYDFPGLKTDARGIAELGPGALAAWFKDTEGNILALGTVPPA